MFDKMKQLMEMKKQADKMKKELDRELIEVNEVRGIKIVINGSQNFQSVELDEEVLKNAVKFNFERDLLKSINAAIKKSQNVAAGKMKTMMPNGFPGM